MFALHVHKYMLALKARLHNIRLLSFCYSTETQLSMKAAAAAILHPVLLEIGKCPRKMCFSFKETAHL